MSTPSNREDAPTVEEIQSLPETELANIYRAWNEVSKTPLYLEAREVIADVAGGPDTLLADSDLTPLYAAVELTVGSLKDVSSQHHYAVKSAVRWGYLASKYAGSLSREQYYVLTHGWRMRKNVEAAGTSTD